MPYFWPEWDGPDLCVGTLFTIDLDPYEDNTGIEVRCEWYKNGQMKRWCRLKNNELDGLYMEHYRDGQVKLRCTYESGQIVGKYEEYYRDGSIKQRSNFSRPKKHERIGIGFAW